MRLASFTGKEENGMMRNGQRNTLSIEDMKLILGGTGTNEGGSGPDDGPHSPPPVG